MRTVVHIVSKQRCWCVCVMLVAFCHSAQAAPVGASLGTLFYTPAQRQGIQQARQPNLTPESAAPSVTNLQGVVRRDLGKGTVWINGKAIAEDGAKAPRIQGVDAVVDGKRLRVGESIDAISGARSDVVAPGSVTSGSKQ